VKELQKPPSIYDLLQFAREKNLVLEKKLPVVVTAENLQKTPVSCVTPNLTFTDQPHNVEV
jgi:hypothetical protein